MCESVGMAQDVCVIVGTEDLARLAAIVGDRSRPLKHVQRARIVVLSAERLPVLAVARRVGVNQKPSWSCSRMQMPITRTPPGRDRRSLISDPRPSPRVSSTAGSPRGSILSI